MEIDSLDAVIARFSAEIGQVEGPTERGASGLHLSASVLAAYDLDTLQPYGDATSSPSDLEQLVEDSVTFPDSRGTIRLSLRDTVRRNVLEHAAERGLLSKLLDHNERTIGVISHRDIQPSEVAAALVDAFDSVLDINLLATKAFGDGNLIAVHAYSFRGAALHLASLAHQQDALEHLVSIAAMMAPGSPELQSLLARQTARDGDEVARQQYLLNRYIRGLGPPLDKQHHRDLVATLAISRWLHGLLPGVPNPIEIERRLEHESTLKPFRFLVGTHFQGRGPELYALGAYLDGPPPSALVGSAVRVLRALSHDRSAVCRPYLVWGLAGMGKSSLVAKLILDRLAKDPSYAFAYLDFERPGLLANEPATLLLEIVNQLCARPPYTHGALENFQRELAAEISNAEVAKQATRGSRRKRVLIPQKQLLSMVDRFAEHLRLLGTGFSKPFVLILDTVELVQHQNGSDVKQLWDFLDRVHQLVPWGRTLVVGRADVSLPVQGRVKVNELSTEETLSFYATVGFPEQLARDLLRIFHGCPLSMRMVAELLTRYKGVGEEFQDLGVSDLEEMQHEEAYAYLYDRMISHSRDEKVRLLALPSLILRWLTPDLLLHVVAPAWDIRLASMDEARDVMTQLSKEISIVYTEGDRLVHRPDVRKLVMPKLEILEPEKVRALRAAAIEWFSKADGDHSRAEEVYHRLMLEQELESVAGIWQNGFGPYLANTLSEVPLQGKFFLSAKLGIELVSVDWSQARYEDWEEYAMSQGRRLLERGSAAQAVSLLQSRSDRARNPAVNLLLARALLDMGRTDEALRVTDMGLDADPVVQDPGQVFDILLLRANVLSHLRDFRGALRCLDGAADYAPASDSTGPAITLTIFALRILRKMKHAEADLGRALVDARRAFEANYEDSDEIRLLLQELASEVASLDRELFASIIAEVGLPALSVSQRRRLASGLEAWIAGQRRVDGLEEFAHLSGPLTPATQGGTAFADMAEADPNRFGRWLAKLIGSNDLPEELLSLIGEVLRHEDLSIHSVDM